MVVLPSLMDTNPTTYSYTHTHTHIQVHVSGFVLLNSQFSSLYMHHYFTPSNSSEKIFVNVPVFALLVFMRNSLSLNPAL